MHNEPVFANLAFVNVQPRLSVVVPVNGNGSGYYLNAWIEDAEGERWQVPLGRVTHTGWRQMTGSIREQDYPWGPLNEGNGVVDYPIRFIALVLDDFHDSDMGSGVIYVDDLTASRQ